MVSKNLLKLFSNRNNVAPYNLRTGLPVMATCFLSQWLDSSPLISWSVSSSTWSSWFRWEKKNFWCKTLHIWNFLALLSFFLNNNKAPLSVEKRFDDVIVWIIFKGLVAQIFGPIDLVDWLFSWDCIFKKLALPLFTFVIGEQINNIFWNYIFIYCGLN